MIGGTELLSAKLIDALRGRGHEFLVVTSNAGLDLPREALHNGIPIRRFPFWTALAAGAGGSLEGFIEVRQGVARLRREFEPDLVHVAFVAPGVLFQVQTARVYPAPLLVTMQQQSATFRDPGPARLLASTLRAADWVVSCSESTRAEVEALVPEVSPRSSVIRNALEPPPVLPSPLPVAPRRLLYVGRLAHQKGVDLALVAFGSIAERFPDVALVIAGDGPLRSELEALAGSLGIRHRVEFLGWIPPDEIPMLMNSATVVVMPSREDPYPLVAIEAALMARPLVAARVGGLREAVVDGETGLLVPPDDPVALAGALAEVLDHREFARQLGEAGRTWALATYSWERFVDAYDDLYQKLALRRSAHVST
jgi:glycogen(starch) synthase